MSSRASTAIASVIAPLFLLSAAGCATVDVSKFPDPHNHKIAVHEENSWPDRAGDLVQSDGLLPLMNPSADDAVFNPSHTRAAMIGRTHHQFLGYPVPVLVLIRNGSPYATLVSRSWPNRGMDAVAWLSDDLVCFDLLAGEDMGWHYVVDVNSSRAVFAAPFADK